MPPGCESLRPDAEHDHGAGALLRSRPLEVSAARPHCRRDMLGAGQDGTALLVGRLLPHTTETVISRFGFIGDGQSVTLIDSSFQNVACVKKFRHTIFAIVRPLRFLTPPFRET